jgi:hypothetical protein
MDMMMYIIDCRIVLGNIFIARDEIVQSLFNTLIDSFTFSHIVTDGRIGGLPREKKELNFYV